MSNTYTDHNVPMVMLFIIYFIIYCYFIAFLCSAICILPVPYPHIQEVKLYQNIPMWGSFWRLVATLVVQLSCIQKLIY